MGNKKKKNNNRKSNGNKKSASSKSPNYKRILKRSFITLCFLTVVAIPFAFYMQQSAVEHDLSVLGNGIPTVVQIHDPNCSVCQQLKNNLDSVTGSFKDTIQFKIANIKTPKGRAFASKHRVPHVTLLFFDKKGERVGILRGLSDPAQIKVALRRLEER